MSGFYESSLEVSAPDVILVPLLAAMAGSFVLWVLLVPISRDRHRAALAATLLVVPSLMFARIVRTAMAFDMTSVVPVAYCVVILGAAWVARIRRPVESFTRAANTVLPLTVCLLLLPVLWRELNRPQVSVAPLPAAASRAAEKPDVFVLVLDGYGRGDVLREDYGFENALLPELQSRQFFVAEAATANYAQTVFSLASALNLDYLPALGFPRSSSPDGRRGLAQIIGHNRFFAAFADAGYHIRTYASEYSLFRPGPADERLAPLGRMDEFRFAAFESTTVPAVFRVIGLPRSWLPFTLHRRQVRWTLEHLAANPIEGPGPALVFAHILVPHPPFVFRPDGNWRQTSLLALINDGSHWQAIAAGSGERYQDGYVDNVGFVNGALLDAVDAILTRARRPTLIVIHGDHGPGANLDWEDPDRTDMRERLGALVAVRFPDRETPSVAANTSLVNVYRAVLDRALGFSLPSLEDRAYFSTWPKPFEYLDVTDRVQCQDCS